MKYFVQQKMYLYTFEISNIWEITTEGAKFSYKQWAGPGFLNLKAIPAFQKGTKVKTSSFILWGEEISNTECFKRRLHGSLKTTILESFG